MKIKKTYQIVKSASDDATRMAISEPYFDKENKCAVATDGRIMAIVPVDDIQETDVSGYLNSQAFDLAKKEQKRSDSYEFIANGSLKVAGTSLEVKRHPEFMDGATITFPNYKAVLPTEKGNFTVSFDAELLFKLAQAIGAGCHDGKNQKLIKLTFDTTDPLKPVRIENTFADGAFGVIMPVRTT